MNGRETTGITRNVGISTSLDQGTDGLSMSFTCSNRDGGHIRVDVRPLVLRSKIDVGSGAYEFLENVDATPY